MSSYSISAQVLLNLPISNIQGSLSCLLIVFYVILQLKNTPYETKILNFMETFSLVASGILMYVGTFLLHSTISSVFSY